MASAGFTAWGGVFENLPNITSLYLIATPVTIAIPAIIPIISNAPPIVAKTGLYAVTESVAALALCGKRIEAIRNPIIGSFMPCGGLSTGNGLPVTTRQNTLSPEISTARRSIPLRPISLMSAWPASNSMTSGNSLKYVLSTYATSP